MLYAYFIIGLETCLILGSLPFPPFPCLYIINTSLKKIQNKIVYWNNNCCIEWSIREAYLVRKLHVEMSSAISSAMPSVMLSAMSSVLWFFLSIKIELSIAMCILLNNKLFLTKDHRPLSSLRLKILVQYSCNTIYGQNAIIKRQCSSRGWPFLHEGLQRSIRIDI